MLKFFRLYSKTLLIVFSSFLLVAFLLPQATFTNAGAGGGNAVLGHAFGEPVRQSDVFVAQRKLSVANALLGPQPVASDDGFVPYLLLAEARRAGYRLGADLIRDSIDPSTPAVAQTLQALRRAHGVDYDQLYQDAADWLSVLHLSETQMFGAGVNSQPQAELIYRDQNQSATLLASILSADAFLDEVPPPTDAELSDYFAARRDQEDTFGEDGPQYGFLQPARVQVEYLTVQPQAIASQIRVRQREARDFYEQNRQQYTEPRPVQTGDPNEPIRLEQTPLTFEEAEDRVREDLRVQNAYSAAQRLVNDMQREAERPWRIRDTDEDGYVAAPDADEIVDFAALRDRFSDRYQVEYQPPQWYTADELVRAGGISRARWSFGPRRSVTFPELALRVKGLYTPTEEDTSNTLLNVGQPSPVMTIVGPRGRPLQSFVFRITAVQPAGPPESLDVVRDEVVNDWRRERAYEVALSWAQELLTNARSVGLRQAVADATDLQAALQSVDPTQSADASQRFITDLGPRTIPNFRRGAPTVTPAIRSPELAEKVFDIDAVDQASAEQRVMLQEDAVGGRVIIAEVERFAPLYAEPFAEAVATGRLSSAAMELQQIRFLWMSPENVYARTQWRPEGAPLEQQ